MAARTRAASRRAAIDSSMAVLRARRLGILGVERQRLIDFAQRRRQVAGVVVGGLQTLRRAANQILDLSSEALSRLGGRLPCDRLAKLFRELGGARMLRHQLVGELQHRRGAGEIAAVETRGGIVDLLLALAPARFGGLSGGELRRWPARNAAGRSAPASQPERGRPPRSRSPRRAEARPA